jgi:DNA recombination protein RmuC
MQTILISLVALLIIANIFMAFLYVRNGKRKDALDEAQNGLEGQQQDIGLKLILEQVNELSRTLDSKVTSLGETVDRKMTQTSQHMNDTVRMQFSESQKLIKDITTELAEVKETGKQVISFADQLQSLQDILKNPKQRGILGEYYLETLLKNVMPPGSYQMQYKFKDDTIVDAVVFVKDKIIPIDSKFSLENYNRLVVEKEPTRRAELEKLFKADLKNRIDETAQYVKSGEGTMDFAFMFIPHEAIYYDLLVAEVGGMKINTRDLIDYAFKEKHVLITSPTSFLAFLQTVLQGLKALQIEEKAKDIIKRVEELGKHIKGFEDYHNKLGTHLGTVVNQYNLSSKELKKIDKDVMRITGISPEVDILLIDKPEEKE